jgi:hypothetical protein
MSNGQMPTSLADVYIIIKMKEHWNLNMKEALHYVCFDMNRKGSNAVSKIASDWMHDNKLAYIGKVAKLSNGTMMEMESMDTGFAQATILKYCTSINEAIQQKCLMAHNEYIGNRKGKKPDEFDYVPIKFQNITGAAYLVKRKAIVATGTIPLLGTNNGAAAVTNREEAINVAFQTLQHLVPVVEPHLQIGDIKAAVANSISGMSLSLASLMDDPEEQDPFNNEADSTWGEHPPQDDGMSPHHDAEQVDLMEAPLIGTQHSCCLLSYS